MPMRTVIPFHAPDVQPEEAISAWEEVEYVLRMPGWERLKEGIAARVAGLQADLTARPRETAAEYERIIGELRGLAGLDQVIEGIRTRAEEARKHG